MDNLINKVSRKLDITSPSRDLTTHARRINGTMFILNVSTDDDLACTDSPIMRTKIINHLGRHTIVVNKGAPKHQLWMR